MLVCEDTLANAIETFLGEARIPRPERWSANLDAAWKYEMLVPAFIKALEQIESVQYCYGFDASKVFANQREQWIQRMTQ